MAEGAEVATVPDAGGAEPAAASPGFNFNIIVKKAGQAMRRGDLLFALGVIILLITLILPMPTWLLDF